MSHKCNPHSEGTFTATERNMEVWGEGWKTNIRPGYKLTGHSRTFMLTLPQKFLKLNK